jgi:hypothetical protein
MSSLPLSPEHSQLRVEPRCAPSPGRRSAIHIVAGPMEALRYE